ncbi:MAG: TIGR03862 family flavoprotein [Chthoniobacterales bacterium]|nr:TIGR03862 family flavoprotein [Chthoniobacterales bacterium]
MSARAPLVLVIGGGPAGLRAAEVASAAGSSVLLCDAQSSFGRKFLIAGRGGLNLTHGEPVENFPARYGAEPERWHDLLAQFGPDDLRAWAAELGTDTYVGTSGRVFPEGQKAAGLLRAWLRRLRDRGVEFRYGARFVALQRDGDQWRAEFAEADGQNFAVTAPAIVLALGGASWPDTGSDGTWPSILSSHDVDIARWQPANCGWNVAWPARLLARAEGLPLKNLTVRAGAEAISGELLITRDGIEGGAIYRLGPVLRGMAAPRIDIDLKPQLSSEAVRQRLDAISADGHWSKLCKLSPAATALIETFFPEDCGDADQLVSRIKNFPLRLESPRPIAEAISSAGGVKWSEINSAVMLRKLPGVFVAGEMIDWEAPTGGYLLQGCFTTGTRAGRSAAEWRQRALPTPS